MNIIKIIKLVNLETKTLHKSEHWYNDSSNTHRLDFVLGYNSLRRSTLQTLTLQERIVHKLTQLSEFIFDFGVSIR